MTKILLIKDQILLLNVLIELRLSCCLRDVQESGSQLIFQTLSDCEYELLGVELFDFFQRRDNREVAGHQSALNGLKCRFFQCVGKFHEFREFIQFSALAEGS